MLEVLEELHENTEILRCHEADGRFSLLLLPKNNTDEARKSKQHTNNHLSWSPSYRRVQWLSENEDLYKASDIWNDRIKKLVEDAQRWKESMQIVSQPGIKGVYTMVNFMGAILF